MSCACPSQICRRARTLVPADAFCFRLQDVQLACDRPARDQHPQGRLLPDDAQGRVPERHDHRLGSQVRLPLCPRSERCLADVAPLLPPDRRAFAREKLTKPRLEEEVYIFSSFLYFKLTEPKCAFAARPRSRRISR
jgi:hypothetical protein